jgi:sec-independent protein translocase protein TatB
MFGLSTWELLVILVVALMFIGPDQLPKVARKLGEGMRQVRGAMTRMDAEVRRTIREATAEDAVDEGGAEHSPHHPEPTAGHLAPPTVAAPPTTTPTPSATAPASTSVALDANRDPLALPPEPEPRPFVVPPRAPPAGAVGRAPFQPPVTGETTPTPQEVKTPVEPAPPAHPDAT